MDFGVTPKKAEALQARMTALGLAERDLEERFLRSGGAGGQHVNRVATCVQLRHVPSGREVKMQKARSQALNRYYARVRLCELLEEEQLGKQSPAAAKAEKLRRQKARRRRRSRSGGANSGTPPPASGES